MRKIATRANPPARLTRRPGFRRISLLRPCSCRIVAVSTRISVWAFSPVDWVLHPFIPGDQADQERARPSSSGTKNPRVPHFTRYHAHRSVPPLRPFCLRAGVPLRSAHTQVPACGKPELGRKPTGPGAQNRSKYSGRKLNPGSGLRRSDPALVGQFQISLRNRS